MNKFIPIIILCFSTIIFYSCTEDSFVKIVEVDLKEEEHKMAAIAFLNTKDTNHIIAISSTLSYDDLEEHSGLGSASAILSTPDIGDIELEYNSETDFFHFEDYFFKSGESYSIEISDSNFETIRAEIDVPQNPIVSSIEHFGEVDEFFLIMDNFRINLDDDPDEENFYSFAIEFDLITSEGEEYTIESYLRLEDNFLDSNSNYYSDLTFNGKSKELLLSHRWRTDEEYWNSLESIDYRLTVKSHSKEEYLFQESRNLSFDSEDNPFVEPSTLYTNFDNGFGIFSVSSETVLEGVIK